MSKTQKVFSILRTAMISENTNDRLRELSEVEKQVKWYEDKSDHFIQWYWDDRRAKQALIEERILAKSEDCEQTDLEEFEKLLCTEKPGLGPNVDFFEYESDFARVDEKREPQRDVYIKQRVSTQKQFQGEWMRKQVWQKRKVLDPFVVV